jgi:spermidine synthase
MPPKDEIIDKPANDKVAAAPPSPWSRFTLGLLVFVAGGVLMSLEIAGSRALAPHFGSSVFVWGSLISVFLIALSVGYYLGGMLADRYKSRGLLNSVCGIVAILVFGVALFSRFVCEWLVQLGAHEQSGPLLASLLLFLPPSVGLGIVSPYAIRLATESIDSVGTVAGRMYALSTIGSIAGTLGTTFVLVPMIGLSAILKGLALVLLATALATLPAIGRGRFAVFFVVAVLLGIVGSLLPPPAQTRLALTDALVFEVESPYHHIAVVDRPPIREGEGNLREMRFNNFVESAIEVKPPYWTKSGYTLYFHLAFLVKPEIDNALFIGAGGGVGPRAFHMHDSEMRIDVVDIDHEVLEIAHSHFFLEKDPNIHTFVQDGRMFVRQAKLRYDCIVLDAFTIGGRIPFHLATREYLRQCAEKMTDGAVFVMNIHGTLEGECSQLFKSMYRTIDEVFEHTYVFPLDLRERRPGRSGNIILLATNGGERLSPDQWFRRASLFETDAYVTQPQMEYMATDVMAAPPDMSQAILFTDDYAPIETMPYYDSSSK